MRRRAHRRRCLYRSARASNVDCPGECTFTSRLGIIIPAPDDITDVVAPHAMAQITTTIALDAFARAERRGKVRRAHARHVLTIFCECTRQRLIIVTRRRSTDARDARDDDGAIDDDGDDGASRVVSRGAGSSFGGVIRAHAARVTIGSRVFVG